MVKIQCQNGEDNLYWYVCPFKVSLAFVKDLKHYNEHDRHGIQLTTKINGNI